MQKKAKEANVKEVEAPLDNITPIRIKSKCCIDELSNNTNSTSISNILSIQENL
jgi:hypothetical protein